MKKLDFVCELWRNLIKNMGFAIVDRTEWRVKAMKFFEEKEEKSDIKMNSINISSVLPRLLCRFESSSIH